MNPWLAANKILLIRLDNLGDVLLTTPAFHAVKETLPNASLTLLTSPVGAQVGLLNPDIDDVIIYQAPWVDPWQTLPQNSEREQELIAQLKERQFDGAIIFTSFRQSALPAAYLCYLADIPLRAGASLDAAGSLLTTRHKHPEQIIHEVERGLDLVNALQMQTTKRDLVLDVPPIAMQDIEEKLFHQGIVEHHPLIVVHPGCSMPSRTYPQELYAQVVEGLVRRLAAHVFVTGSSEEGELVEQIQAGVGERYRYMVQGLAGTLSFAQLCALIKTADLTITNNTGPMHISAAVKTPVVALFALTNPPEQWGPWLVLHQQLYQDVPCRICYTRVCPYEHQCLRLVTPQMVVDSAQMLLEQQWMADVHGLAYNLGGEG